MRITRLIMSLALILISLSLLSSCGRPADSIIIAGSTSVQRYIEILAEAYSAIHPGRVVDVQGGGSSAGITAAVSGTADVGMSSRNLKDDEDHLVVIEIAKDGLAIIVNPANPLTNITIEDIRMIYTGRYTDWSQLGGASAKINVIAREEGSGTRSAFEEMIMDGSRIIQKAITLNSNGAVRQAIAGDPHSIGFISLGLVEIGENPVKALRINSIEPTRENIENETYALYRSFLFVMLEEPEGLVLQFIDFMRSPRGREILAAEGLVA